ncbi:MAG TPA: S-methyl-5'-thioadenosine phosphorylase [Tepidisphaeraceae bacterium]|nr:S-methyl-5'-thioadenosine phosphorylase [Tepidisphaeraceae bacterium]
MSEIKIGLIGGSGLGAALSSNHSGKRHEIDTPFGLPSDAIVEVNWSGKSVYLLSRHGPGHLLNPSQVPYRANIFALKKLGCTHIIASGAVGSLREEFAPRHLVIPDQIIDKTHKRANTFFDNAAVHSEFAEPFCPVLRQILLDAGAGRETHLTVHDRGCYVAMEGPAFSTRAESLMHRIWGGDLIGMTCMPEAKLAREAEIAYALIALVTDYDCWRARPVPKDGQKAEKPDPCELLKEIIGNLEAATNNAFNLMQRAIELMAGKTPAQLASPAHQSLQLGIWSEKAKIAKDEVQRLAPLWIRYFQ